MLMCVHDTFAINSESAVNSNKKSAKCKVFLSSIFENVPKN